MTSGRFSAHVLEGSVALTSRPSPSEGGWTARLDSGKATAGELPLLYTIARYEMDLARADAAARAMSL